MSAREFEEKQFQLKIERLREIQQRIEEITNRARTLRLEVTEPVRTRVRERFGQFLDRLAPPPASQPQQAATCPACGAKVPKGARFCPECGATLTRPTLAPRPSGSLSVEV